MMLTIHGLPPTFNYHELKMMIKHESSLNDFILDNLVGDVDGNKKVRIGVADESEGSHLIKCLDGFRLRGNVLKVIPVAKAPINTQQGNFNQRPGGYPLRNDLQNQPGNYTNPPSRPMGASPWTPNSNQWNPNQGATPQMQRNTFQGFQPQTYAIPQQQPPQQHQRIDGKPFGQHDMGNRMPPRDQGFGFQQKNIGQEANRRLEARQLRNVEVIPSAGRAEPPGRAPERYDDKPVTINKDYFQGSSQFGGPVAASQQGPHFVPQNQSSQWSQSAPQAPKPGFKPAFEEDRKYPPPDKRSALLKEPEARAMPNTYKEYEKSRYSPPRRASPGPPGPPGRRPSPGRRVGGRLSPSRRLVSPTRADRRETPPRHIPRYSPPRRADKGDKFPAALKHVRPAYEPEAPNQAMYSGGYRPSHHEGGQYPPGARPERGSPWQHERDKFQAKKDDDRPEPKHESPAHASRSPNRRERSPLRDRYRRNSPSPRSLPSPRRSWALEKRLSPELSDAPPPPTWPGPGQEQHLSRPGIGRPDKEDKPKHAPWDRRPFDAPEDVRRRAEPDNRPFKDELRVRRDLGQPPHTTMQPSPGARPYKEDRFSPKPTRASRFEPMTKFEQRDPKFEPRDPKFEPRDPKFDRRDPNFDQRDTKFDQRDPKFDLRDPKFDQRVSKFDQRDPKFEPRDPKFDLRDHKFEPREPKFEPRDPKFDPRPSRFDQREPKFEPRDPKFEPRDPKFDTRAPKFEPRDSNYAQRDPKFEPRVPKFEPRDPKFDSRDPKFEPRDPKYHQRDPKFEPRDPKFEPRDPKFEPRDPKFDRREPNFEPRDPKFDRHAEGPRSDRRDFRRMDELAERKDNFRSLREDDRDDYRRDDFRREKDDHKVFDKEFDDIYKRAMEFKQKVQELRRTGRSHDREEYDRRRMDERRPKFEDNRDYRDMDRRDERPRSRDEEFGRHREPEWQIEKLKPKLDSNAKAKREKAAEEISDKIIDKHATFSMSDEVRLRVYKELKFVVLGIMDDMFGNNDVSFIESVIKFNSAHTDRDGYKIFQNVIGSLPEHLKSGKRRAEDASEIPAKVARHSPEDLKQGSRYGGAVRPRPKPGVAALKRPAVRTEPKRLNVEGTTTVNKPTTVAEQAPPEELELDRLTARVLEEELQQIMMQVWQALPDYPPAEEKRVVNKFRNEASDNLRNVLGLNITKRLLNTFNPLNVKVHFTTKPDRKYLREFLQQYKFVAFKRIARVDNTFAARLQTLRDYDRLCTTRDIRCGAAKITITPYYRFRQCPKNLRTMYNCLEDDIDENLEDYDESNVTTAKEAASQETKQGGNTQQAASTQTESKSVATNTVPEENRTAGKDGDKTMVQTKVTPNKTASVQAQLKVTQVENKATLTQPPKPQRPVKTPTKPQSATTGQVQNSAVTKKPVKSQAQTQAAQKTPVKTQSVNTENKSEVVKPTEAAVQKDPVKPNAVDAKQTAAAPKTNVATPKTNIVTPKANTAAPETEVTAPKANMTTPKTNVVTPKADATAPKTNVTTPKANVATPKPNVTAPKANVTTPKTNVVTPKSDATAPKTNVTAPKANDTTPKANVASPKPNVTAPKANVATPKAIITPPKTNATGPKADVASPKTNVTAPKTIATASKSNVTTPKSNVTAPKANVTTPKTNVTAPKASAAPKTNITAPKTNVTTSKTNVTNPKTNATTTKSNVAAKSKIIAKATPIKKTAVVNKKAAGKADMKPTIKPKTAKKIFEEDAFEELDDEAIFELMSGGIVLDECCGSDDE